LYNAFAKFIKQQKHPEENMHEVLIVEDNNELRGILKEALESRNCAITDTDSAEEAAKIIKENNFDLVITDLKLPGSDGITVLDSAKERDPYTEVIVITAYGTVDKAVAAMKRGAADFVTKPFSIEHIRIQVDKILKGKKIKEENAYLKNSIKREMIGQSSRIKEIHSLIDKIAKFDATVLITGESGTGKELVAEDIHNKSDRRDFPLIKVNCAALAPGVLESELFGHEKGAFTDALYFKKGRFELAEGGTIMLDEIADLPLSLQVKILRVIQEKEFERVGGEKTIKADVRIIAATNKDLKDKVKEGTFREELYYRLNVVGINVPPLRERKEDLPLLVDYFIKKYADYGDYKIKGITKGAMDILKKYDYPGNIRELENIIQRIMVVCTKDEIDVDDIPYDIDTGKSTAFNLDAKVDDYEKKMIIDALEKTKGNKKKASELLRINRVTLISKIKKYGLK
jgi:DNA-binding NtrC family response regulator